MVGVVIAGCAAAPPAVSPDFIGTHTHTHPTLLNFFDVNHERIFSRTELAGSKRNMFGVLKKKKNTQLHQSSAFNRVRSSGTAPSFLRFTALAL